MFFSSLQNNLINKWTEFGRTELPGEEVLVLAWLHSGIQVSLFPLFLPLSHSLSLSTKQESSQLLFIFVIL